MALPTKANTTGGPPGKKEPVAAKTEAPAVEAAAVQPPAEVRRPPGRRDTLLGRMNSAFQEMLQTSRGPARHQPALAPTPAPVAPPHPVPGDLPGRRERPARAARTLLPDGAVVDGALTSASDTEVGGRVAGDVVVGGHLYLAAGGVISGAVRATSCKVEGLVEGPLECAEDLEISRSGRVTASAAAGRTVLLAGQVTGRVTTGGRFHLAASGKVTGDVDAQSVVIEEGGVFNGRCHMGSAPNPVTKE